MCSTKRKISSKQLKKLKEEASLETTTAERLTELAQHSSSLAKIVAANAATPAELLEELAKSKYSAVRKAVTGNPNTPVEILWELGAKFPEELLANPVFDLLLLENPNLKEDIPVKTVESILRCQKVPQYFLKLLSSHSNIEIQQQAKLHVNSDLEIGGDWQEIVKNALEDTSLENNYDSVEEIFYEVFSELIEFIPEFLLASFPNRSFRSTDFRKALAINNNTPVNVLEELSNHKDSYAVYECVARNPNTPAPILERLANNYDCYSVASNPNTPASILEKLANNESSFVRKLVANNPNTPVYLLEKLASDEDKEVLRWLGQNENAPASILEKLAADRDRDIRWSVAVNKNAPASILEKLAADLGRSLRSWVAKNPNTPAHTLEKLADKNCLLATDVASNPNAPANLLKKLADEGNIYVCRYVASNPNTPISTIEKLADEADINVRRHLAKNPNTPARILEKLGNDRDSELIESVLSNPNTPIYLVEQLAGFTYTVRAIVNSPNIPANILLNRINNSNSKTLAASVIKHPQVTKEIKQAIFNKFANTLSPSLSRLILLFSPYAYPKVVAKCSLSSAWLERYAIGQNIHTSNEILDRLTKDANQIVRNAAIKNLHSRQIDRKLSQSRSRSTML